MRFAGRNDRTGSLQEYQTLQTKLTGLETDVKNIYRGKLVELRARVERVRDRSPSAILMGLESLFAHAACMSVWLWGYLVLFPDPRSKRWPTSSCSRD